MTPEPGVLNLVVQGGSFALLAWIFVYWLPRVVTGFNGELAANRAAIEKVVDRTMIERKEDRDARHALANTFNESLIKMFMETARQTERITEAIRIQTDKFENKMDGLVGLLQQQVTEAKREAGR